MKAKVVALADERGESESVIVREAINAYLMREDGPQDTAPPAPQHDQPITYKIKRTKDPPKRKAG